jgi:peptidoglycan lytic transglycosylase B
MPIGKIDLKTVTVVSASAIAFVFALTTPAASKSAKSTTSATTKKAVPFSAWVLAFKTEAKAKGIRQKTIDRAFKKIRQNKKILKLDSFQPEFVKPVGTYVQARATADTLKLGRAKLRKHAKLFARVRKKFGVPAHYIAAIWRLESGYGQQFGKFYIIEALTTLAHSGRRSKFWRGELLAALQIADKGYVPLHRLVGSWAGAMGHTQFIPSTYLKYAVDFDGDRRRDLWRSLPDVFASTANYLKQSGWVPGLPFGVEVKLPKGFDYTTAHIKVQKPVTAWRADGVTLANGKSLPAWKGNTAIVVPSGYRGPIFLVSQNYRALLKYNNAAAYALAVGILAERLVGRGQVKRAWPVNDRLLRRVEKEELQRKLTAMGYDPGEVDGKVGPTTKAAIRKFQHNNRKPADGYANYALLQAVRRKAPKSKKATSEKTAGE